MILITYKDFYMKLKNKERFSFYEIENLKGSWNEIKDRLSEGESMSFIGVHNIELLNELWIFTTEGLLSANAKASFADVEFQSSPAKYIYIRPPKNYSLHGVDDHPRMDMIPLITDYDCYGSMRGYPAMLLKNVNKSMTGSHFKGGFWFVYAIDKPLNANDISNWEVIFENAISYSISKFYIAKVSPEYPLYYAGEKIRIDYEIENCMSILRTYIVIICSYDSDGNLISDIGIREEALSRNDKFSGSIDWYPEDLPTGIYTISVQLRETNRFIYGTDREENSKLIDNKQCGVYIKNKAINYPVVKINDRNISIDGKESFFIGTHLYPSSNFFELSYRDVNLQRLKEAIETMKNTGIKICRIWADPILDELSVRGMEVFLDLFAINGITVIFMVFSSWTHYMCINMKGYNLRFEVAHMTDERLIGLYMHNMEEQKLFVSLLSSRWSNMEHIIWDFSNEYSIVDPREDTQLNVDWLNPSYKSKKSPDRNNDLFNQWAQQINSAIRSSGAFQPVIFGVCCWNTGCDTYRSTKLADVLVEHGYYKLDDIHRYIRLTDTSCIKKPLIVEEFGGVWPDMNVRAEEYDGRYHHYLAAGICAAINYEWGVIWLSNNLSGMPAYLKFMDEYSFDNLTDYVYNGRFHYAKTWLNGSVGLCPWMASFEYGNIYPCTDMPSQTMLIMKRTAQLGEGISVAEQRKLIYVILPIEHENYVQHQGYSRKTDNIASVIEKLAELGVEYNVWQQDEISSIPKSAKVIIYPNHDIINEEVKKHLDEFKRIGIKIYTADDKSWVDDPIIKDEENVCILSDNQKVYIMNRRTSRGILKIIDTKDNKQILIKLGSITCGIKRFGSLLENNEGLIQAEICGNLSFDDKIILSTTGKCLIRSNDNKPLHKSKDISIFPYEIGEVLLAGIYEKATIMDGSIEVGNVIPDLKGENTCISIGIDELLYEIRVK